MWFQVELPAAVSLTEMQFDLDRRRRAAAVDAVHAGGRSRTVRRTREPPPRARQPPQRRRCPVGRAVPARRPRRTQPGGAGYPRGYTVTVSLDGKTWSAPVRRGEGTGQTTVIAFAPVNAKFVRITQTAAVDGAPPWSIQRLRLYRAGR